MSQRTPMIPCHRYSIPENINSTTPYTMNQSAVISHYPIVIEIAPRSYLPTSLPQGSRRRRMMFRPPRMLFSGLLHRFVLRAECALERRIATFEATFEMQHSNPARRPAFPPSPALNRRSCSGSGPQHDTAGVYHFTPLPRVLSSL